MRTFAEWKAILTKDFRELKQLTGQDAFSKMRYAMKEQEIGQHCYEAAESLTDAELSLLKRALGLSEKRWRAYKAKLRPEPE